MSCSCRVADQLSFAGDVLAQLYFRFCTFFFWFINLFIKKQSVPAPRNPILLKSSIEIRKLMRTRQLKSIDLIQAYSVRIEEVNPFINVMAFNNFEEAREQAKAADKEISHLNDGELNELYENRPFFGMPFTCKDSIQVKGKPCTIGIYSRKVKNEPSPVTAAAVQKMFDAGAILLGITTVPETCLWLETNTVAYGRTNNPYDTRRIVGGSSGGEGAIQGSAASLMGLGSDIGGSVRIPAFHNGVFGMISTPGAIPLDGHIPGTMPGSYKEQMAKIGPLTRFAEDLPMMNKVLSDGAISQDEKVPLKKMKVYYVEGITHNQRMEAQSQATMESMKKAVRHFEEKYDIQAHAISLPETKDLLNMYGVSLFEEGDPDFRCTLKDITKLSEPLNCWLELLKSIFGLSQYSFPVMTLALAPWFSGFSSTEHKLLREKRDRFKKRISELLGDDGVLFYPSWQTLPQYHWETVAKQTSFPHTGMINMLVLAAVQCPMGLTDGVPNGVQIITNQGNEKLLLDIAQEVSTKFGGWVPPREEIKEIRQGDSVCFTGNPARRHLLRLLWAVQPARFAQQLCCEVCLQSPSGRLLAKNPSGY